MALSIGSTVYPLGKRVTKQVVKDITFDNSYATGGESLTASDLGLANITFLKAENKLGYVVTYDYANQKLMAFYGDNNNAADGPLVEVPNATDLSTLVCKVYAIGY